MNPPSETWLLLDDSVADRQRVVMALSGEDNVGLIQSASVSEAKTALTSSSIDVLLTDYVLENQQTCTNLIQEVRSKFPNLPVVVVSGYVGKESEIYKSGADQVVPKPLSLSDLRDAILNGVRQAKARREAALSRIEEKTVDFLPKDDPIGIRKWKSLYRMMRTSPLDDVLSTCRELRVLYALHDAKGNKSRAAVNLKIERQTLYKSKSRAAHARR